MILLGYIVAFAYALLCIALGALAGRLGLAKPYTRKIVHVTVGFEWVILSYFMGVSVHFFLVCAACFAVLFLSYRFGWFSSTMGSDGDNGPGTVYYGLSMTVMAAIMLIEPYVLLPFGVAVFCTSFGDGIAGVVGQAIRRANPVLFGKKTLWGTLSAAVICTLCVMGFSHVFSMQLPWYAALMIGIFCAEVELLSTRGLDNIFVPLGCAALTYACMQTPQVYIYVAPLLLTPVVLIFAARKKALTRGGIAAALGVDVLLSIALGNAGFLLLLLFFSLGVLADAIGKKKKSESLLQREEKGSCRDAVQVLANAAIPTAAALLYAVTGRIGFLLAFVASMAEALGDTVASGIGVLSERTYDLFHMRRCERGMSGGMSVLGTLSSVVGCLIVALAGWGMFSLSFRAMLFVLLSACLGTLVDSMLGSLVQLKYRCSACGMLTERREHCEAPTQHVRGVRPFNNDVVNIFGSFSSACFVILCSFFL